MTMSIVFHNTDHPKKTDLGGRRKRRRGADDAGSSSDDHEDGASNGTSDTSVDDGKDVPPHDE